MRIKYPLSNRQNTEKGMNNGDNNRHREEVCGPPMLTLGLGVAEVLENCHILCLVVPHAIVVNNRTYSEFHQPIWKHHKSISSTKQPDNERKIIEEMKLSLICL